MAVSWVAAIKAEIKNKKAMTGSDQVSGTRKAVRNRDRASKAWQNSSQDRLVPQKSRNGAQRNLRIHGKP